MSLTQHRDLRTGKSVWQAGRRPRIGVDPFPGKQATCDAVVIGSGISGALLADALQHSGLSVAIVDRRPPLRGSTPASTALLQFELDTPLTVLAKKVGRDKAIRAWLCSAAAVSALASRVADLGLACDFRARDTIYLPGNVLDGDGLRHEAEMRRKIGLPSAFMGREALRRQSGIARSGAILSHGNAEADPVRLTAGLLNGFRKCGGKIFSPFDAVDIEESKTRVRVSDGNGRRVVARHLVFCSGYEMPLIFRPPGYRVISTWAIATRPQSRRLWPGRELIWEASDPYMFFRTTADGRALAGGGDEDFSDEATRDSLIAKKAAAIARHAGRIFPDIDFDPDFSWTGNFGASPTGMPAIGLVPGYHRAYAVLGFGGNGITFSMLAARLLALAINGVKDPDLPVFGHSGH